MEDSKFPEPSGMTQYEMICYLKSIVHEIVGRETEAHFYDDGLKTMRQIEDLIEKYDEIDSQR